MAEAASVKDVDYTNNDIQLAEEEDLSIDGDDFSKDIDGLDQREAAINENSPIIVSTPKSQFQDDVPSRRRHNRFPARWPIKGYAARKRSDGQWEKYHFSAFSEDVSESGIGFFTQSRLRADDRCVLHVSTYVAGKKRNLNIAAKVKFFALSGGKYRCGVEFINLSESNKNFILRFVQGKNPHSG